MNVNTILDGIGTRLATISGLRVHDFPPGSISPPAAIVAMPETIGYDQAKIDGLHQATITVYVAVGRYEDRASRDRLAAYQSTSGDDSLKAAIEADVTLGGSAATTQVTAADTIVLTVGSIDYLASTFTVDVWAT